MTPVSDNSLLTLGIYLVVYVTLGYTLANSAFKAIDLMPNWVMTWIGARMESRVDDASAIQQTAGGYMQTMAYSSRQNPAASSADQLAKDSQTLANMKATGLDKSNPSAYANVQTTVQNDAAKVGGTAGTGSGSTNQSSNNLAPPQNMGPR